MFVMFGTHVTSKGAWVECTPWAVTGWRTKDPLHLATTSQLIVGVGAIEEEGRISN